jgi:hypothetical protein
MKSHRRKTLVPWGGSACRPARPASSVLTGVRALSDHRPAVASSSARDNP